MSVKQGLMALLAEGPMYGAQLRVEFEERTGGTGRSTSGRSTRRSTASSVTGSSSRPDRPTVRAASPTA